MLSFCDHFMTDLKKTIHSLLKRAKAEENAVICPVIAIGVSISHGLNLTRKKN